MAENNKLNKQEKIAKALKNQQARGGDSAIAHEEEIAKKISSNQNFGQSQRNLDSIRPINPQIKSSPTMGIGEAEPENVGNFQNINRGQQQKTAAEDFARNETTQAEAQAPQNSVPTTGPQAEANRKPLGAIDQAKPRFGRARTVSSTASAAANQVKGIKDAVDWAQKGARALAGDVSAMAQLAIKGLKNLWKDPRSRAIIIVILVLNALGIIFAIVIPLSLLGIIGQSPNSVIGKSTLKSIDLTNEEDKKILKQVNALQGNQTAASELISSALEIVKVNSSNLKKTILNSPNFNETEKSEISVKIDNLDTSIDALNSEKTSSNAKTLISRLTDLDNSIESKFAKYPSDKTTRAPFTISSDTVFNSELHGGSFQHPDHIDNSGVYTAYDKGSCDAVDIGAEQGTSVYPIFSGTVVAVNSDGADGKYIVIKDGDYRLLYAHLVDVKLSVGDTVTTDTEIGLVKINHIQLESTYKNQCLVTTYANILDHALTNPIHNNWGGYLWDSFINKFHIQ